VTDAAILNALRQNGWCDDYRLQPLDSTGNNRVLRADTDECTFLIKHYFQHPEDSRDRFNTERVFYTFLWDAGIRRTPRPLAWFADQQLALFEFVFGKKPTAASPALMNEAIDFLLEMNRNQKSAGADVLPIASEACFSIEEHLQCVSRRVRLLQNIVPEDEVHRQAVEFVHERLQPVWERIRAEIERSVSSHACVVLEEAERCISPSDFGFHNTIIDENGELRFFDFEYAGWDDPAKTICDFFCQPAVPVPLSWLADFLNAVAQKLGGDSLKERASLLLPVYQTKWCCIMLNEFLPVGGKRRVFSDPALVDSQRRRNQLEKALAYHRLVFP
jgi:hypothetical protein